jgi:hypothetical protein
MFSSTKRTMVSQMPETSHVRSEELRSDLLAKISEVAKTGASFQVGVGPLRLHYELVPTTELTTQELDACVRVTADRARKNWSDLRATARLLDVTFLIVAEEGEAVFRRYPEYVATWPKKWMAEHSSRAPRASASPTTERSERIEGKFPKLQQELARMKRRICEIERKIQ